MTNPDRTEAPGDVNLAAITVTRSLTSDGDYANSYAITGDPSIITALGMLTWATYTIHRDYREETRDDPEEDR